MATCGRLIDSFETLSLDELGVPLKTPEGCDEQARGVLQDSRRHYFFQIALASRIASILFANFRSGKAGALP